MSVHILAENGQFLPWYCAQMQTEASVTDVLMCWSEQMCALIWQVESECRCVWNGRLFSRRSLLFCLALCYLCRSGVIALIRERRTHLPLSVCLSEGGRGHVTHMTLPARPLQLFTPASPEMTDSRGLVPAWSRLMTTLSTCHFTAFLFFV